MTKPEFRNPKPAARRPDHPWLHQPSTRLYWHPAARLQQRGHGRSQIQGSQGGRVSCASLVGHVNFTQQEGPDETRRDFRDDGVSAAM